MSAKNIPSDLFLSTWHTCQSTMFMYVSDTNIRSDLFLDNQQAFQDTIYIFYVSVLRIVMFLNSC